MTPWRATRLGALRCALALGLLTCVGCERYTLIVVTLESELVPGVDFETIRISVHGARIVDQPEGVDGTVLERSEGLSYPFSFVLSPRGDVDPEVTITALDRNDNAIVTQTANVRFEADHTVVLRMRLAAACRFLTEHCVGATTCDLGVCIDRDRTHERLPDVTPGRELDGLFPPPPADARFIQRACLEHGPRAGCGIEHVEGATFEMGDPAGIDATPMISVTVAPFDIDRHEFTLDRLQALSATENVFATFTVPYPSGEVLVLSLSTHTPVVGCTSAPVAAGDARPVTCREWGDAAHLCALEGGRLPTSSEWELAARHRPFDGLTTPRTYPWGEQSPDAVPCAFAYYEGCGATTSVYPVGQLPAYAGIHDLAGNAAEWTSDVFQPRGGRCFPFRPLTNPSCLLSDSSPITAEMIVRGGAVERVGIDAGVPDGARRALMGASLGHVLPDSGHPALGFRCVYSR